MFFIFLSITTTLIPSIVYGLQGPIDGYSNDPQYQLIRPYIHENTSSQVFANIGDSVKFECYATGTPGANISIEWSRPKYINAFELNKGDLTLPNGELVYRGNVLWFPSVEPKHAGSYDCNAYEGHTLPGSRSYLLSIKSKPTILNVIIRKTFNEASTLDTIKLFVEHSAVPKGKVFWYKNDELLNDSDKYQIDAIEQLGNAFLSISAKDNDYYGTYKYVTENDSGKAEYSFEI